MLVFLGWKSRYTRVFYNSYTAVTDYGKCCYLSPQFEFETNRTIDYVASDSFSDFVDFVNSHGGDAAPSVSQGLRGFIDVEAFETASNGMGSSGFRVSVGHVLDKPLMNYNAIYVSPGNVVRLHKNLNFT